MNTYIFFGGGGFNLYHLYRILNLFGTKIKICLNLRTVSNIKQKGKGKVPEHRFFFFKCKKFSNIERF